MILSDQEIFKLINDKNMITPFQKDSLQSASYDISIGNELQINRKATGVIDIRNSKVTQYLYDKKELNAIDGYIIKSGEFVLIKTLEKFTIPDNVVAYIRPRTSYTRLGLVLSGQFLNPTFSGNLFLGVKNESLNDITIFSGLNFAQIVFEKVEGNITPDLLYKNKKNSKFYQEDTFRVPDLSEEAKKVYKELQG